MLTSADIIPLCYRALIAQSDVFIYFVRECRIQASFVKTNGSTLTPSESFVFPKDKPIPLIGALRQYSSTLQPGKYPYFDFTCGDLMNFSDVE